MKISTIIITCFIVGIGSFIAGVLLVPAKWVKPGSKFARDDQGYDQGYEEYLRDNFQEFTDSVSHPFENNEEQTMRLAKKANAKAKKTRLK